MLAEDATDGERGKGLHPQRGRCAPWGPLHSHAIAEAERAPLSLRDSALNEVTVILAQTIEAYKQLLKTHTSRSK